MLVAPRAATWAQVEQISARDSLGGISQVVGPDARAFALLPLNSRALDAIH